MRNESEEQILSAIADIFTEYSKHTLFEDKLELLFQEAEVLRQISEIPVCTMKHLVDKFQMAPSTATNIVDRLVAYEFVTREGHPNDRRKVVLNLTNKGHKLVIKRFEATIEITREMFDHLTKEEVDTLARLLRKVTSRGELER
ncbi:MAG: MarR family winged helix-turn-helix transcriptional regulator [Promethearchaeota archaeon]